MNAEEVKAKAREIVYSFSNKPMREHTRLCFLYGNDIAQAYLDAIAVLHWDDDGEILDEADRHDIVKKFGGRDA